jgi:hypothetical protein
MLWNNPCQEARFARPKTKTPVTLTRSSMSRLRLGRFIPTHTPKHPLMLHCERFSGGDFVAKRALTRPPFTNPASVDPRHTSPNLARKPRQTRNPDFQNGLSFKDDMVTVFVEDCAVSARSSRDIAVLTVGSIHANGPHTTLLHSLQQPSPHQ